MLNKDLYTILLVEDDPDDAELTLRALKRNNLLNRVYHVKDGEEALEILFPTPSASNPNGSGMRPKVILLDLKLPKVNGIEVLRRIRRDTSTKNIPVVMLTSSRETSDLTECYALGVNSYIVKPVDSDNFSQAVSEIGLYWAVFNEIPY